MLKSVDILIGYPWSCSWRAWLSRCHAVFITTLNTCGSHLMRGLKDLLQQLDPALTRKISKEFPESSEAPSHPVNVASGSARSSTAKIHQDAGWISLRKMAPRGWRRTPYALKKGDGEKWHRRLESRSRKIRSFTLAL